MTKIAKHASQGSAEVTLEQPSTIVCRLQGVITGAVVKESMRQTALLATKAQVNGPARLLLDISGITKQTSEARSRAKDLSAMGFERIAVAGGSRVITTMGRYIAQAGGMGDYTRFFRRETEARHWLDYGTTSVADGHKTHRSIAALLLTIIGAATLLGWVLDVPALRSFVPIFKPMNPLTAVTFIALAIALISMRPGWQQNRPRRSVVLFVGLWTLLVGLSVLIRFFFQLDIGLDSILLNAKLGSGHFSHTAPSSGVALLCVGVMLLLLISGQPRPWQRYLYFWLSSVVFLLPLIVIISYSFGFGDIYNVNVFLPMALNTAIAFLILVNTLVSLSKTVPVAARYIRLFYAYWQAILLTFGLILVTGIAWHQSKRDITSNIDSHASETFIKVDNTLQSRLSTYNDALNGYKGLFAASSDVAPGEFHNYFANSKLSTNYPGFLAISYAAVVPDAAKSTFITQTRNRATADFPKYRQYSIFPESSNPYHYALLYVQPSNNTTNYGFDLSTEQVRREALEKARDSGESIASGIINLNASRGANAPHNDGFFLSTPIYKNGNGSTDLMSRRTNIQGFVITYFQTKTLFESIFKNLVDKDTKFTVSDVSEGTLVYASNAAHVPKDAPIKQSTAFVVGGRSWRLNMYVSPAYGRSELYRSLPWATLIFGMMVSGLAGALALAQLRRRDQALFIAARMTEDLNSERNKAVATQQKDEAVLSSIGDAVFAIDTQERITLFNQACERISGYTASEVLGKKYTDILQFRFEKDNKENSSFVKRALQGHITSMKNHTVLIRKDGRSVAVADSAAPIRDARQVILGAIVVFRDVSKEQELDRAKTEFVSLASHQLRTPLSAINWYGELLLGGDAGKLTKDQLEYVHEIYEGNQRMIDLVNSLLDVSRLDLGKLSNQPSPTDMKAITDSLEKELTTSITAKKLSVVKQIQADLPPVLADPKLLRMIVQNLFSNAVKYTPDNGSVHITLRKATESELHNAKLPHGQYVFLSVTDTGYGIPKAQQAKIFTKLFRADNVRSLDVEGTGLGLYIVKEVVEKLGGRVWFTSIESAGSTFYVILPIKTKATEGKPLA